MRVISDEQLQTIISAHGTWLKTQGKEGERADLSETDLTGRDLKKVNLARANLHKAALNHAHLEDAQLSAADLSGAYLGGAWLDNANLKGANLQGAYANRTDFTEASLRGADLRNATLTGANLTGADLIGSDANDSDLGTAHFSGARLLLTHFSIQAPIIENIHQKVYEAASQPGALDMRYWHYSNGTSHCWAGWVTVLAGAEGEALEKAIGTSAAAALIMQASDPKLSRIPYWFGQNKDVLEKMAKLAA